MKRTTLLAVALTIASAAAVLPSCSNSGDTANAAIAFDTFSATSAYALQGSAADFGQTNDIVYLDSVSLILPLRLGSCDIAPLRDTIASYAFGITGKPIVPTINTWLEEMARDQGYTLRKLDTASVTDAQGFDFVNGFVVNLNPQLLVYCVRSESYIPGAAHGLTLRRYINFSLQGAGHIITLDKLFTPQGLKELPARIAEQAEGMAATIGETSVTDLPADGNFFISSEGEIVFSYQPYEIASYAQGTIDVPFYPYELVDYMTPYAIDLFSLRDFND